MVFEENIKIEIFDEHNSKIYHDRWQLILYGSITSRKKPPLQWIYDFNKIRESYVEKYEEENLETLSSVATNETFEISGGNAKEFILYKRHSPKSFIIRKIEEDDYKIGANNGLIELFCKDIQMIPDMETLYFK